MESAEMSSQKKRTTFSKCVISCTVFILFFICSFYLYGDLFNHSRHTLRRLNNTLANVKNVFTSNFTNFGIQEQASDTRNPALVLLWTSYFSEIGEWLPPPSKFRCPVSACRITANRSLLKDSDAVIFHWRNVNIEDLPKLRLPHQRWVLFNKEAPPNTPSHVLNTMADKTNWTVTYRRDSDIHAPYGYIKQRVHSGSIPTPKSGRKQVCWLVSNCKTTSVREDFVERMKKFIPVDVYGQCGTHRCPVSDTLKCYDSLSKKYKFYLSFENSICKDYATEKLYNVLQTDMVPVVMGGENYRDVLPPNSYIDALNFEGPRKLAEYLLDLDKNDAKYMTFLAWKKDFQVVDGAYRWICDLCKMLHENSTSTHGSLMKWWYDDAKCSSWMELTNSIFS